MRGMRLLVWRRGCCGLAVRHRCQCTVLPPPLLLPFTMLLKGTPTTWWCVGRACKLGLKRAATPPPLPPLPLPLPLLLLAIGTAAAAAWEPKRLVLLPTPGPLAAAPPRAARSTSMENGCTAAWWTPRPRTCSRWAGGLSGQCRREQRGAVCRTAGQEAWTGDTAGRRKPRVRWAVCCHAAAAVLSRPALRLLPARRPRWRRASRRRRARASCARSRRSGRRTTRACT